MGAAEDFRKLLGKKKVHVDSFAYSIKDEYVDEFLRLMNKRRIEMERDEIGGNKGIHSLEENE